MSVAVEEGKHAMVLPELRPHLLGHTDRARIEPMLGKMYAIVPGSEKETNGRVTVDILDGGGKKLTICKKFLWIPPEGTGQEEDPARTKAALKAPRVALA